MNNSPAAPAVTIYRGEHPRSRSGFLFTVYWRDGAGAHRERFADEAEAIREAKLKAEQLYQGDLAAAGMSKEDRDELAALREMAKPLPVVSALKEWAVARDLTRGNVLGAAEEWASSHGTAQIKQTTVAEVVDAYCKAKTGAHKNVAVDHASAWNRIKRDLGALPLATVSVERLTDFLHQWESPGTVVTFRKRLVSVWRWAKLRGYLPRNQITVAEMTEVPSQQGVEIGVIEPETLKKLLEAFRARYPAHLPALVLANFCGLRAKELRWQTWEDIHLDAEEPYLQVSKAKVNTPAHRVVHLSESAVAWLNLTPVGQRKGWVSPLLDEKPVVVNDQIRLIVREHKIADLPPNCFRHSFISYYLAWKKNIPATAIEAGNSEQIIHSNYKRPVPRDRGQAWFDVFPENEPLTFEQAIKTA